MIDSGGPRSKKHHHQPDPLSRFFFLARLDSVTTFNRWHPTFISHNSDISPTYNGNGFSLLSSFCFSLYLRLFLQIFRFSFRLSFGVYGFGIDLPAFHDAQQSLYTAWFSRLLNGQLILTFHSSKKRRLPFPPQAKMASKASDAQPFAAVLAAVATMQGNVSRNDKAQAHEYLEKFQKSVWPSHTLTGSCSCLVPIEFSDADLVRLFRLKHGQLHMPCCKPPTSR